MFAFLLVQRPGRLVCNPGIGLVSQAHDFAHGAGEIALLVSVGNQRCAGGKSRGQFRGWVGIDHHASIALLNKARATTGDVYHLADQVGVDLLNKVVEIQVKVFYATAQLGRVVVTQVFRGQMIQISTGLDKGAARLGHLLPVHRQVAVYVDCRRLAETCTFQHGRPEQGVEVNDVLADKVIQLGAGIGIPESIKTQFRATLAQVLEAGHVANGRVQPDVKILAGLVRDLEAEVGRITADIPLVQAAVEPLGDLVGNGFLQRAAARPLLEHVAEVLQTEEEVLGILQYWRGARDSRARVFQLGRLVRGTAFLAVVAVLVFCAALGAGALDEAIGQKHLFLWIEILRH